MYKYQQLQEAAAQGAITAELLNEVVRTRQEADGDYREQEIPRAMVQAEQEGLPLQEVEEKLMHISHAEVGAYLLSLWGLPCGSVEAVAHHHHPWRVAARGIDMILAVYFANLLANEVIAAQKKGSHLPLDLDYLRKPGALDLLPNWRTLATVALSTTGVLVH